MVKFTNRVKYYRTCKQKPEECLIKCKPILTEKFLHHNFSPDFMEDTEKELSKISEFEIYRKMKGIWFYPCCSLSVFQTACTASFYGLGYMYLYKAHSPHTCFEKTSQVDLGCDYILSVCVIRGKCYYKYSIKTCKELKVLKQNAQSAVHLKSCELYPHSIGTEMTLSPGQADTTSCLNQL